MRLPLLICATFQILIVSATSPYVVEWNTTHSYGPDDPWPVVTIQVGKDGDGGVLSWMDLHPGGIWESMLPTKAFCDSSGSPNPCLAENAGLYNVNASSAVLRNFSDEPAWVWQWGSESAFSMSGQANNVLIMSSITWRSRQCKVESTLITRPSLLWIEVRSPCPMEPIIQFK